MIGLAVTLLHSQDMALMVSPVQSERISLQAIVRTPTMSQLERQEATTIVEAIPRGTAEYSSRQIHISTDGIPVIARVMPDHIRIAVSVNKERLQAGLNLMDNLLSKATLAEIHLNTGTEFEASVWPAALWRSKISSIPTTQRRALALYRELFQADRITLSVLGPVDPSEVQAKWNEKVARWPVYRNRPQGSPTLVKQLGATDHLSGLTSLEFSAEFDPTSTDFEGQLVALAALGSGKGASLFRVSRQKLGLSYVQEAVLWPSHEGLVGRLIVLAKSSEATTSSTRLSAALKEDVANWTESDLARAQGILRSSLTSNNPFSLFYLSGDQPLSAGFDDQAFMNAYWLMKTGSTWKSDKLLARIEGIALEETKERALEILSTDILVMPL